MYDYRKWSLEKQAAALKERVAHGFPLHSPPHVPEPDAYRIITGACFEHKPILDAPDRMKLRPSTNPNHKRCETLASVRHGCTGQSRHPLGLRQAILNSTFEDELT
ncbi:MAG: hypothetical protein AAF497_20215 [Planctomycetota bacterium]